MAGENSGWSARNMELPIAAADSEREFEDLRETGEKSPRQPSGNTVAAPEESPLGPLIRGECPVDSPRVRSSIAPTAGRDWEQHFLWRLRIDWDWLHPVAVEDRRPRSPDLELTKGGAQVCKACSASGFDYSRQTAPKLSH
jgi:hypothetical protein